MDVRLGQLHDVTVAIIVDTGHIAVAVGGGGHTAQLVIGVAGSIVLRIGNREQIMVGIIDAGGLAAHGIRDDGDIAAVIIFIGGGVAAGVLHRGLPSVGVVGKVDLVAFLVHGLDKATIRIVSIADLGVVLLDDADDLALGVVQIGCGMLPGIGHGSLVANSIITIMMVRNSERNRLPNCLVREFINFPPISLIV